MGETVLEIRDLNAFYGQEQVLAQVSLSVTKGEVLCVAGESGSGKSTLLGAICGNHLPVSDTKTRSSLPRRAYLQLLSKP